MFILVARMCFHKIVKTTNTEWFTAGICLVSLIQFILSRLTCRGGLMYVEVRAQRRVIFSQWGCSIERFRPIRGQEMDDSLISIWAHAVSKHQQETFCSWREIYCLIQLFLKLNAIQATFSFVEWVEWIFKFVVSPSVCTIIMAKSLEIKTARILNNQEDMKFH